LIFSGSATDEPPNFMTTVSLEVSVLTLICGIVACPATGALEGSGAEPGPSADTLRECRGR
jgi:hypothetical protein